MLNNRQAPRKLELLPLIDVIFLLLIFFMVTMNIIPGLGRQGQVEYQFPVEIPTPGRSANVDRVIQIHNYQGEIFYICVDKYLMEYTFDIELFPEEPALLQVHFTDHFYNNLDNINFEDINSVLIRCEPWLEYHEVLKVSQKCIENDVGFYFSEGSVANLGNNLIYGTPDKYDWKLP